MTSRARILRVLALAAALLLLPAATALADRATYDRVSDAYSQNAGQLDACWFSQADLEAALAGIPRAFEGVIPDLRRAIEDGIAAHRAGDCEGIEPTGGPAAAETPPATTTPTTPTDAGAVPPADAGAGAAPPPDAGAAPPADAGAVPPADAGATPPAAEAPQQVTTTPGVQPPGEKRSTTPLVIGAAALAALLLLVLLVWGWARLRGWDPTWAARARHAWGEAGFRVTSTWAEFSDWLRLGR
ncbi:hypothetical protein [Conexibacter arvalis]|uniref:Uncharacterized protein n=1 Tax=Conexibacter arvalis TaxID=912552 RepID=A0A840IBX1_9ACTN|nr:hypothetical protein [Conexibacter arvalis]MBB4661558.1 hypothetical protein [Conexibacter arvalis]